MDLSVLYDLTYGLYAVGALDAGARPVGCIINTCFQVTSQDPRLVISLNKNNYTLEAIRDTKRFTLSIIAEETDPLLISVFGFSSSRTHDKYADFGIESVDGVPAPKGKFCGRLLLEAEQFVDCGTHVLVVGALRDTLKGSGKPMTYSYYHNVVKGKAPKNAPTYRAEEEAPTPAHAATDKSIRRYRCDVCGYIAEVPGELPPDYICPVCKADRSHFHEITG